MEDITTEITTEISADVTTEITTATETATEQYTYNSETVCEKLDTVIDNQNTVISYLNIFFVGCMVVIGFKLLWTVVSKWFFGGI